MPDQPGWDYEQHFTVRACTVMLLYVIALCAVGLLDTGLEGLPEPLVTLLQVCGWSSGWVLLAAALLSSAFFVESLIARRPQAQFVVELLLALATWLALRPDQAGPG